MELFSDVLNFQFFRLNVDFLLVDSQQIAGGILVYLYCRLIFHRAMTSLQMMTSSSAILDCDDGDGGGDDDERYCVRAHLVAFDLCRALLNCDERTV